jgi:hypothetical protein
MTVALQWHVATNTSDPVALATSRNSETGIGQKDVVIVVCDAQQGEIHDTRLAAGLARSIFDAYSAHEQAAGARSADRIELAQRLSDAIMQGLKCAQFAGQPVAAGAPLPSPDAPVAFSVVAAMIHGGQLFVARFGSGDVFLLRAGQLLHLTDAAFAAPHTGALEPDLGQLDMAGEDRILLCNTAFSSTLKEGQVKSVLRATPSSRKAAYNLLDLAERTNAASPMALAVADYVTGQTGVFPAAPISQSPAVLVAGPRRGTFRTFVAALGLIVLVTFAAWAFSTFVGGNNGIPVTPGNTLPTLAAPTPAGTIVPALIITPTETLAPSPTPTLAPTSTPAPTATPTVAPTNTPEPTATETPVPTRRPVRRQPTATPVPPTATPEPPTPQPTLAPTDTPAPPPPPSNSGGGGGGGQPPPQPTSAPGCDANIGLDCLP